jgi:hypothetical protein
MQLAARPRARRVQPEEEKATTLVLTAVEPGA